MYAEDIIDRKGVPQIDFVRMNEIMEDTEKLAITDPSLYRLKKFQRAIRRLVLLTRAAKKQGKKDYNIGALVYELADNNYE